MSNVTRISGLSATLDSINQAYYLPADSASAGTKKINLGKFYSSSGGELSGSIQFKNNTDAGLDGNETQLKFNGANILRSVNNISADSFGNVLLLSVMTEAEYNAISATADPNIFYFIKED